MYAGDMNTLYYMYAGDMNTLYYMYVGDMNTLYKSILRNPTRGRDVPRRVSTSGHVLSGWGCCGCIYIICRGYKYIV